MATSTRILTLLVVQTFVFRRGAIAILRGCCDHELLRQSRLSARERCELLTQAPGVQHAHASHHRRLSRLQANCKPSSEPKNRAGRHLMGVMAQKPTSGQE